MSSLTNLDSEMDIEENDADVKVTDHYRESELGRQQYKDKNFFNTRSTETRQLTDGRVCLTVVEKIFKI
jgi:hypothetical protein